MKKLAIVSARLSEDEKQALEKHAQRRDRTCSYIIRRLVRTHICGQSKSGLLRGRKEAFI